MIFPVIRPTWAKVSALSLSVLFFLRDLRANPWDLDSALWLFKIRSL